MKALPLVSMSVFIVGSIYVMSNPIVGISFALTNTTEADALGLNGSNTVEVVFSNIATICNSDWSFVCCS